MKYFFLVLPLAIIIFAAQPSNKPWPRYFKAYKYMHRIKDSTAKHGGRMVEDSVDRVIECDYVNKTLRIGDSLMIFDSVVEAPFLGDSERVFMRGLGTESHLFFYLDRRVGWKGEYKMLMSKRGFDNGNFYSLRPLPDYVIK